ncbi:F0F1 ATP synthase subunit delta [Acetobacteraceae bacterium KSS12]|uniref:ATP synthase subunit delta n=2 Tax=Rhizosaccharibacter radicis TaxID=2782605 RepID=A0ABT1W0Z3_9PROT|nr:F0F1 ATP synthase subunit delta [Acetobacteraceae bacterium KSS12]
MSGDSVSGRYALALYELADERRALDEVVEQAEALAQLIDESAPMRSLLSSRTVDVADARRAIADVMESQGFDEILRNFAGVVANNRRLSSLRSILSSFAALVAARRGVVVAEVVSAHPLTDVQRTQLRARLTEAGYSKVNIQERVDGTLLGGLVVRIGARLYDASVKNRLNRLHHAMKGAA